ARVRDPAPAFHLRGLLTHPNISPECYACNSQPKSRSREDEFGQASVLVGLSAALGLHDLLALAGNLRQVRSRATWLTERHPRLAQRDQHLHRQPLRLVSDQAIHLRSRQLHTLLEQQRDPARWLVTREQIGNTVTLSDQWPGCHTDRFLI